jgi:4-hydroxy-tetrahydrodipicolinate reductase
MLKVAIAGAAGRMGRALAQVISERDDLVLIGAFEKGDSPFLGKDIGEVAGVGALDLPIRSDLSQAFDQIDLLIDFTLPDATLDHLERCVEANCPMVIGATGLSNAQQEKVQQAGERIPLIQAANYSVGVNLMLKLVHDAARVFGESVDLELFESHHRDKVDAPSGTALELGRALASAREWDFDQCATFARSGHTGKRDPNTIGFSTLRGGDVIGEHTVFYLGAGERLEIAHRATDRLIFARGAVRAALWLKDQEAGLYGMEEVLSL